MANRAFTLAFLGTLFSVATRNAVATEYYVATTGSDGNPGTMAAPFANLQKGADVAAPGDTVWIRGGTYKVVNGASSVSGIAISKGGQSDAMRVKFWAYQGETPIFDFSSWKSSSSNKANGFYVTASWVHIKGLEIMNLPQAGTFTNSGLLTEKASNNIFELLNIHHIGGPGLFINGGNGGNLILNCDAHDDYDPKSSQGDGQNADGFGVHYQSAGATTILRGCRAWWNSDDGYDLISQEYPVTIDKCWAMGNGYTNSGTTHPSSGNGNGFKAGSSKTGIRHTITSSVAWKNGAAGFYANHSSGGNNWYNNTSLNNGVQYNLLASPSGDTNTTIILTGSLAHKMRNNVGFPDKNTNMGGVDTASNTWDLKITPANTDFVSVADTGFMGPRQADGSLPPIDFVKLSPTSQLIDQGTDVGSPFVGKSPDLGAYEFGAPTGPSGGSSNSGGSHNSGGSGGATDGGSSTAAGTSTVTVGGTQTSGGSTTTTTAGTAGGPVAGTSTTADEAGNPPTDPQASAGCTCALAGNAHGRPSAALAVLAILGLSLGRRRRR